MNHLNIIQPYLRRALSTFEYSKNTNETRHVIKAQIIN